MLAALLLLGLVPLAFLPVAEDDQGGDELSGDDTAADTGNDTGADTGTGNGGGDLLDAYGDQEDQDGAAQGRLFEPETGAGEYDYGDFRQGSDRLRIDLTREPGDTEITTTTGPHGAGLTVATARGSMILNFVGHGTLPAGDIEIVTQHPETGEPLSLSLADLLAGTADTAADTPSDTPSDASAGTSADGPLAGALEDSDPDAPAAVQEDGALDPVDPDDPGEPGGGGGEGGLDPLDPDDPGEPGGGGGEEGLDPLNLDPPPSWGAGGDPAVGEALQAALTRDSAATAGLEAALERADHPDSSHTVLGEGDDVFTLPDDGVTGTGEGEVTLFSGTAAVTSDAGVAVVDGAGGDDTLVGGDGAAWLFGGPGEDSITTGEGATAAYGGDGDDAISAAAARTGAFIDGGAGDDTLTGGPGNDIIEGGSHGAAPAGSDDDVIEGGAGDDLLRGGYGADVIRGGAGDDVIDHHGRIEEREEEVRRVFSDHIDGAADVLDGGPGNDTLIMDSGDTATGGQGEDYFWVWSDGSDPDAPPAIITDFEVGTDFLHISLNPELGAEQAWDLRVEPSPDGQDGHVIVAGDLVAVLKGAPDATAADVYVEVKPDVFATAPQG